MSRDSTRTIPLTVLLPDLPDAQDACVRRLTDLTAQQPGVSLAHATEDGAVCVHFDPSQTTLAEVEQRFGSVPAYLEREAGLDAARRERLRDLLLV
jgi:Cd2+/Zn2+-exporting ATPase